VRILLVDDEVAISNSTGMLLEYEGYTVDHASHGREGLERVEASPPDLIITDYMMPYMDGLAMIGVLRAQGWTGPIILVSAVPEENLPETYERAHDAYLVKPYRARDLPELVRILLEPGGRNA
jgi:DNA-binding response OmpR family regulator